VPGGFHREMTAAAKDDTQSERRRREAKDELSATIQMLGAPAGGFH
jgi:hypothetical protein